MRFARRCLIVTLLAAFGSCGDDAQPIATDCAGGPAGGSPLSVAAAASAELDECEGGFAVRGHAFIDGDTLTLCEAVAGSPEECRGSSIEARIEDGVKAVARGAVVIAALTSQDGRIVASSIVVDRT